MTQDKPALKTDKEVKAEKRAAALRDNLKRRKAFIKESKTADVSKKDK